MHSATRRLFVKQIKLTKWQRKMSLSARLKTDDYVIKSPLSDVEIPDKNFLDVLWEHSAGYKNHIALLCADTKKSYTYQQLMDNVDKFATSLHKKFGLQPGDVIGVMLPNCPEFSVVAFGTLRAGCKLTAINPIYKEFELCHQVTITEPKLLVTIAECYDTIVKGLKAAKSDAKIVVLDRPNVSLPSGAIRFSEIAENTNAEHSLLTKVEVMKDDIAFLPFSSGTTGLPKGVEITYQNLVAGCAMMAHEKACYPMKATADFQDVVPCVLPFFHIYGLVVSLIGHLRMGCKLVSIPRFSPNLYFDVLKNEKATLLYIVPPIAILLGKHPDVGPDHVKHVRRICSGAAPLSSSDIAPILEKCKKGATVSQGYGATETTSLVTTTPIGFPDTADKSASGVAMSNMEMKFVDPVTGQTVPVGEQGELYVRGPTIMKGYYKNEEATKDSLTEDRYFKTGDLGYYKDGDGLYITDRIKELIKVKGMQVAPAELESLLRSHPDVADAAVIGIPHEIYGETPKAFIIPKNGKTASSEDIQNFVASKVAPYKKIEEVQFVKDIPKTASGKIMRRELKKMYA